ncbi:MAG: AAA family ATPase [Nitrospirae bacterium]|nr:AAA family ATPase [Nitrospirota bacterium]
MRTIAIVNQKGGCGKTTTAINLSACLAQRGKRVALIDLDPQGHATLGLDVKPEAVERSAYQVFSEGVSLDEVMISPGLPNLHLIPATLQLSVLEQRFRDYPGKEGLLQRALEEFRTPCDYLIIDSPPSLGFLSVNALRACDEVIVPVDPSFFSLHGLGRLMETLEVLREETGHGVTVYALPTLYDRRSRFAREVVEELSVHFGERVFKTPIRASIKLREAASFGWPIGEFAANSIGAWDYAALADEVIAGEDPVMDQAVATESVEQEEISEILEPMEIVGTVPRIEPIRVETVPVSSALSSASVIPGYRETLFIFRDPAALEVKIAGDFNNWTLDRDVVTLREADGTWKKIVPLREGTYQYKYWVDGEWRPDPGNPRVVRNQFGGINSCIAVGRPMMPPSAMPQERSPELS